MRILLVAMLVSTISASSTAGQVLRGTVRDAATGSVLSGVFVTLNSADGVLRVGALSDTLGRFYIQTANSGRYTLRAQRIGYQTATQEVALLTKDALDLAVSMNVNPLRLQEIAVTRERRCTNNPAAARETVTVWEEARKALSVAAWLEKEAGARFQIRITDEDVNFSRQPIGYPAVRFDSVTGRSAFRTLSADSLLDLGFAQLTASGHYYYGPDAELLVSPRFVAEHCFSIERRPDRAGQVGLAFEPMPETRLPDIRGALWIDEQSGALQFIEYEYVNLPIRFRREYAGGRVNVRQLANGAFVVESYRIHTPLLLQSHPGGSVEVRNLHERTGEILEISMGGEKIELVPRFTVRGIAFDSLRGRPLSNVRVGVPGTSFMTTTDRAGRYTLEHVPRGRYAIAVQDMAFASRPQTRTVGFHVDSADVDVTLGLPSRNSLVATICPDDPKLHAASTRWFQAPARLGVLQLHMINPDGTPWLTEGFVVELLFLHQPADLTRDAELVRSSFAPNSFGEVTACGFPVDKPIEVHLVRGNERKAVLTVKIPRDGLLRRAILRN